MKTAPWMNEWMNEWMELLFKQTLVTIVSQLQWASLYMNAWEEELDSPL